ncbi:hypothetical protein KVR01_011786 [Diaporthe batatas]|uniref:uncharacterized protein n=1 Tax=Diaporthe batatas TaxID=748121 RepID=UPI001D048E14|nr:uncharacterized protein KVR01_011786 [Diaporthe batatas]KAG8158664.1 hypothetical protein KVR01_011786 [Diaporthe batatas]
MLCCVALCFYDNCIGYAPDSPQKGREHTSLLEQLVASLDVHSATETASSTAMIRSHGRILSPIQHGDNQGSAWARPRAPHGHPTGAEQRGGAGAGKGGSPCRRLPNWQYEPLGLTRPGQIPSPRGYSTQVACSTCGGHGRRPLR